MALHSGIDTVAVISFGVFTKTYGSTDKGNIASLFTSRGLYEKAATPSLSNRQGKWLLGFYKRRVKVKRYGF